jgi:short-subunit dehydrogenase
MRIADNVVLITGASDGIGAACARAFRAGGAKLSLCGRSAEKLERVAEPGDLTTALDLTASDSAPRLVNRTLERFGRIDIVINNAAMGIYWPVSQSPLAETRAMFELNVFAALELLQAALPLMRARNSGLIVNVGSIAGRVALPWMPLYSASKSALDAITEGLRMELAGCGVRTMLVCPGSVLTDFHLHGLGLAPPPQVVAANKFAITPEQCARDILRGVERDARVVMSPRSGWIFDALHHLMPQAVESILIKRMTIKRGQIAKPI